MTGIFRGRLPALAVVLAAVGLVLLAPVHPEAGILHLLGSVLPAGTLAGGSAGWWTFEDLGNIALFVPVGAVAARLVRPVRALLVGIAISATCEGAQLLIPARHASLQDVLLNALGVGLGVAATVALRRSRAQARATRPHSVQAQ